MNNVSSKIHSTKNPQQTPTQKPPLKESIKKVSQHQPVVRAVPDTPKVTHISWQSLRQTIAHYAHAIVHFVEEILARLHLISAPESVLPYIPPTESTSTQEANDAPDSPKMAAATTAQHAQRSAEIALEAAKPEVSFYDTLLLARSASAIAEEAAQVADKAFADSAEYSAALVSAAEAAEAAAYAVERVAYKATARPPKRIQSENRSDKKVPEGIQSPMEYIQKVIDDIDKGEQEPSFSIAEETNNASTFASAVAVKAREMADASSKIATPTTPSTLLTNAKPSLSKRPRTPGTGMHINGLLLARTNPERLHLVAILNNWINEPGTDTSMDKDETEIRMKAARKIMEAYDTNSPVLSLLGVGVMWLPDGVLNNSRFRKNLVKLDVSLNKFEEFPRDILALENLKILNMSSNKFTFIPTQIEKLINLRTLDLSSNKIIMVPTQIGKLKELRMLSLGSNQIASLPTQLGSLHHLHNLDLSCNELEDIHSFIINLPTLSTLMITRNRLTSLPQSPPWLNVYDYGQKNLSREEEALLQQRKRDSQNFLKAASRKHLMGFV